MVKLKNINKCTNKKNIQDPLNIELPSQQT